MIVGDTDDYPKSSRMWVVFRSAIDTDPLAAHMLLKEH